jgi:type II secretory pathway pseudopilin PulG
MYSRKQKTVFIFILLIAVGLVIFVVQKNYSRSRDLQLVSQAKMLATGLENYFNDFNAYPEASSLDVKQIGFLTENGFNQEGEKTYFSGDFKWVRSATLQSDGLSYKIDFELNNTWPVYKINKFSGGLCRFVSNVVLQCQNKP